MVNIWLDNWLLMVMESLRTLARFDGGGGGGGGSDGGGGGVGVGGVGGVFCDCLISYFSFS